MLNNIKKKSISLALAGVILVLNGCGGGGSDTSTNSTQASKDTTITGTFVDSAVSGLNYSCSSGTNGITDAKGEFTCPIDDNVSFTLGGILLGSTSVVEVITPYSLFSDDIAALNLAQFLQTLDSDGDPSNGISPNPTLLAKLSGKTLDFTDSNFDTIFQTILGVSLRSEDEAREHLNATLIALGIEKEKYYHSFEKLIIKKRSDLGGYKFTSVEFDNLGSKDVISVEFTCDTNFRQEWKQTYEGLSPSISFIEGDEIYFESVTAFGEEGIPRIRWSGIDKFGQSGNDGYFYLKNHDEEVVTEESCFGDFDCSRGIYIEKIEQTNICLKQEDISDTKPRAIEQFLTFDLNSSDNSIELMGIDENDATLTYTITSQPENGNLNSVATPSLKYMPESGFIGYDSFTFKVNNGQQDSNIAKIIIRVYDNRTPQPVEEVAILNGLEYGIITSPYTGKRWLDRNLGASEVCSGLYHSMKKECYGDLYQWGRYIDGHEKDDALRSREAATNTSSAGPKFITTQYVEDNSDWVEESIDDNGEKRISQWSTVGRMCPPGFRVPTIYELNKETIESSDGMTDVKDAAKNFLRLPPSGFRSHNLYALQNTQVSGISGQGLEGFVWSTTVDGLYTYGLKYRKDAHEGLAGRAYGATIRCIEN